MSVGEVVHLVRSGECIQTEEKQPVIGRCPLIVCQDCSRQQRPSDETSDGQRSKTCEFATMHAAGHDAILDWSKSRL